MEPVLARVGEAAGLGGLERLLQQRHVAVQLRAPRRGACKDIDTWVSNTCEFVQSIEVMPHLV